MTDSVDRLATPKDPAEWLHLVARTDGPDELTKMVSPEIDPATNATPTRDEKPKSIHAGHPHVYVVYDWHGRSAAGGA